MNENNSNDELNLSQKHLENKNPVSIKQVDDVFALTVQENLALD